MDQTLNTRPLKISFIIFLILFSCKKSTETENNPIRGFFVSKEKNHDKVEIYHFDNNNLRVFSILDSAVTTYNSKNFSIEKISSDSVLNVNIKNHQNLVLKRINLEYETSIENIKHGYWFNKTSGDYIKFVFDANDVLHYENLNGRGIFYEIESSTYFDLFTLIMIFSVNQDIFIFLNTNENEFEWYNLTNNNLHEKQYYKYESLVNNNLFGIWKNNSSRITLEFSEKELLVRDNEYQHIDTLKWIMGLNSKEFFTIDSFKRTECYKIEKLTQDSLIIKSPRKLEEVFLK